MAMHRHQSSLEGLWHYDPEQTVRKGYKPAALIQATLQYVASPDTFLTFFLSYIYEALFSNEQYAVDFYINHTISYLDGFASSDSERIQNLNEALEKFAEYIVDNFLLPLRASSVKTPQPTPTLLSSLQSSTPTGTSQRISVLRQSCLVRDRHRCVISSKFDRASTRKRFAENGESYEDDDGKLLKDQSKVAHILPHCLTTVASGDTDLSDLKKNVLRILDMFDPGIGHLINGLKIDSPLNALTLTLDYHRIDLIEQRPFLRDPLFPVTRSLTLSPHRTIDLLSARLLDVHRAIAHIINMSGAGEYIDKVLWDMEELDVREDGLTRLGYLAGLRLNGWFTTLSVY
ncbi:uncharacterized protein N7503_006504 [Penicillium pulvis]|uniref:uncharacterized protein n=1 Tax=Penicillium pulvis TaxID=1562058 RepID=UPI0025468E52|nr:uncharacterized protein N7503_006504 [Penicillium pulvis]KAJ5798999.1 hypothetical protein N7503_006504 [Penicillium pulvis]